MKLCHILTHLTYRVYGKKPDIPNNNSQFWKHEENACKLTSFVTNDIIHGIRWCNVIFTLESRYNYIYTYVT